jgi:hypothetical protein
VGEILTPHPAGSSEPAPSQAAGRANMVTIIEAAMLAGVTVLAAWSGYAAARWGTESSLHLARASAARTQANQANLSAYEIRNFDSLTFNAWLDAYAAGNQNAMDVTQRRFRPEFRVAFDAWMRTDPLNPANEKAPAGPTYMAEYKSPEAERAVELDAKADGLYAEGAAAGSNNDSYVRTTVFLASVLFLVGISGHFPIKVARYGLIALGAMILTLSIILLVRSPFPSGTT